MKVKTVIGIIFRIMDIFFKIFQFFTQIWVRFYYRKPGKSVPPISNCLLLDSATTLALKIRNREVTSVEVVQAFINRIKEINPILNCVVDERFDKALIEARKIDEMIDSNSKSKEELENETPLLGVPFTFKCCVSVTGFRLTAGLYARRNIKAEEDAEIIHRMRKVGAIPLASTNVSELCLWWESFNPVHGRTSNPYDTNRIVGGSSGGEGCAQGAAAAPMGLGSDIGGSIRIPAFLNGVFGHKPTNGVGSLKGHFPYPEFEKMRSFLVIGPMSRFAVDLKPMLKAIAGPQAEELKLNEKVDFSKLKIYYMEDDTGSVMISKVDPEIKKTIRNAVNHFEKKYGVTAQKVSLRKLRYGMMIWFTEMVAPNGPIIPKELTNNEGEISIAWETFKFFTGLKSNHTLPILTTAALEQITKVSKGSPVAEFYSSKGMKLKEELEKLLGTDGVFFYPTMPTVAPHHVEPITRPFDIAYTGVFNILGFPVTHIPTGLNIEGLPIGFQVAAGMHQDRYTLAVSEELEKVFGGWVPPSVAI